MRFKCDECKFTEEVMNGVITKPYSINSDFDIDKKYDIVKIKPFNKWGDNIPNRFNSLSLDIGDDDYIKVDINVYDNSFDDRIAIYTCININNERCKSLIKDSMRRSNHLIIMNDTLTYYFFDAMMDRDKNPKDVYIKYLRDKNKERNKEESRVERIEKKLDKLIEMVMYMPNGIGMLEAKEHFNELCNKEKN